MSNTVMLIAQITPQAEYYEEAKAALKGILAATREESGCLQFELTEENTQGSLFLYEEWTDQEALDQHYAQPYIEQVFKQYENWLACPVKIINLQKVA